MISLESIRSFLRRLEVSEEFLFPRSIRYVRDVSLLLGFGSIDSARKTTSSSVPVPVLTVGYIRRMGNNPQVRDPVVVRIPIDVIHNHSLGHTNLVESKYNPVNKELSLLSLKDHRKHQVHWLLSGVLNILSANLSSRPSSVKPHPFSFVAEVMERSLFPVQLSGFLIVFKRLLKIVQWRQFSTRLHSGISVWSLGAFGSSELLDAPSLILANELSAT